MKMCAFISTPHDFQYFVFYLSAPEMHKVGLAWIAAPSTALKDKEISYLYLQIDLVYRVWHMRLSDPPPPPPLFLACVEAHLFEHFQRV